MAMSAVERKRAQRARERDLKDANTREAEAVREEREVFEEEIHEAFETGQAALRFADAIQIGDEETLARVDVWLRRKRRRLLWLATEWLSSQGLGEDWASFLERSE